MSYVPPQDEEVRLVERAVEGDRAAFTLLYDRNVTKIYRHVYYRMSDKTAAEDVTQEVFIKAWRAIGKYKITGAPFVAWLLTIARNQIADHYRAAKNPVPLEKVEARVQGAGGDPEAVAEANLDREAIRGAVLKLKEDKQKVILMRFIDGFSYEEIAKILKKSEGAVRVIQYRALSDLKRILGTSR